MQFSEKKGRSNKRGVTVTIGVHGKGHDGEIEFVVRVGYHTEEKKVSHVHVINEREQRHKDSPALVENTLDTLLKPLAIPLLPSHNQLQRSFNHLPVRKLGLHQRHQNPRRLNHLRPLGMRCPHVIFAALVAFTPTAIRILLVREILAGSADALGIRVCLTGNAKGF